MPDSKFAEPNILAGKGKPTGRAGGAPQQRRGASYNPHLTPPLARVPSAVPHSATSAASAVSDAMAAEMAQVDRVIQDHLRSDVALVNQIAHYIITAGGKRIRPRLVLLFAN